MHRGDLQQVQVVVILEHADEMHTREIEFGAELLQHHLFERGARRRRGAVTDAIAADDHDLGTFRRRSSCGSARMKV